MMFEELGRAINSAGIDIGIIKLSAPPRVRKFLANVCVTNAQASARN